MTSVGFDFEDEDSWLTPAVKSVGVQSAKKFDIDQFLGDVKLPETAGTLSKKIAKFTKKRAALERMSSLCSVKEESPLSGADDSSASSAPTSGLGISIDTAVLGNGGFSADVSMNSKSVSFAPSSIGFSPVSTTSVNPISYPVSSTPKRPGINQKEDMLLSVLSPISSHEEYMANLENLSVSNVENENDVFYDAPDDFSPEAMQVISMTASYSSIESLLSSSTHNDNGQSCVRTGMSQSLIKVEEEESPIPNPAKHTQVRQARSSSVSPRAPANNGDSLGSKHVEFSKSNVSPASQSEISPQTYKDVSRNSLETSDGRSQSRASPNLREEFHRDLQQVTSLAQQQEEALRQAVKNLNERKHSWQGDPNASIISPHSSAGSLASSKSVDIAVLNKATNGSTPLSRLPGPSRLPRRTAIPIPTKVQSGGRGTSAVVAKHGGDPYEDCF